MSSLVLAAAHIKGPRIDWSALAPFVALGGGALLVLLLGLLRSSVARERAVPLLTILSLGVSMGFEIGRFKHSAQIVSGALAVDDLALVLDLLFCVAALAVVVLSWRGIASTESGHGEYHSLLLFSVLGMTILVSSQNLITLFIGIELLSIPLYVLCASEHRREGSLESGLKYLVIGSVGSATLVYGLAMVYGATGSTDFATIGATVSQGKLAGGVLGDPLLLSGLGLVIVGFAFKASVAPFHQWTPDVYEGAPTPITAFMATATKAAAIGVFLRFFDVAAIGAQSDWAPALATLAAVTMIVGNVGALGQSSLKRMLGYSGVAQAGYMLTGVVVGTRLGIQAAVVYLLFYLAMNLAAFGVIVAVEREDPLGDDIGSLAGLGARQPWLAWPMTIAMLALAGLPGTVGFIGKFQLIHALVDGHYTWLGIVLVIGSMISLGYYLRIVATMWMGSPVTAGIGTALGRGALAPIAGGSAEADEGAGALGGGAGALGGGAGGAGALGGGGSWDSPRVPVAGGSAEGRPTSGRAAPQSEVVLISVLFGAACVFFGIFPSPLFHLAAHAGRAIVGIF